LSSGGDSAESLKARGNAQRAAGDLEGAVASYRRSLELEPDHLPSLYNLGMALHEAERFEEAERCFRRVLALDARDADALFHLGALLQRRLRLGEATDAYRRALALRPGDFQLTMRLGDALLAGKRLAEAERCFDSAAALRPESVAAHFNLGVALRLQGRHERAVASYRHALELRPDMPACVAALLAGMQHVCDWSRFDELCGLRRRQAGAQAAGGDPPVEPFGLLSIPATLSEQLAGATAYSRWICARAVAEARRGGGLPAAPAVRAAGAKGAGRGKRLRIGYLSCDFHEHVTAHAMAEVFELHDRDRVETVAYSYGPDDGSPVRARLKRAFDRFTDLGELSDAAAAAKIRGDGVDVLIDLKGYTEGARTEIVALRPAAIQASYLGYPASMGADFIDYIITDRFVLPPEHARFYREQPAYLPGSYYPSDRQRPVPEASRRAEAGLPEAGFVFCCFNQAYKILPEAFAAWMRLLRSVPGSVLWLLEPEAAAAQNLRREASLRGVAPARLVFAPKSAPLAYLARLRAADLFLDTWPYNAHTTASDALWVGVPVVTLAGDTLPSRVAGSQLRALGFGELVTESTAAYEALALCLAREPGRLDAVRDRLWQNRTRAPLFDIPRFVRHLEMLYEEMRRVHAAGGAPRPIDLAP
jgi:protein O-GlcNAc transferase